MYRFSKPLVPLAALFASMLLIGLVASENSAVQTQTKTQVEGVWKLVEVVMPAKDPAEKATSITAGRGFLYFIGAYLGGEGGGP